MTTPLSAVGESGDRCWCCGGTYPASRLVHLGEHPEVAVCWRCATFLRRRATEQSDALRPSVAARGRSVVRHARSAVLEHGWQDSPVVGRVLRWVDRALP